jgi:hypothetical protein
MKVASDTELEFAEADFDDAASLRKVLNGVQLAPIGSQMD